MSPAVQSPGRKEKDARVACQREFSAFACIIAKTVGDEPLVREVDTDDRSSPLRDYSGRPLLRFRRDVANTVRV